MRSGRRGVSADWPNARGRLLRGPRRPATRPAKRAEPLKLGDTRYAVGMTEKPRPPLPADDDEARMDDDGSAVGHPEPAETEPPTPKTSKGDEIPPKP